MRVGIVGGGVAGLAAALGFSDLDCEVCIFERDRAELPADPETAFARWRRPGVPQMRLHHTFLPRSNVELEAHAPEVLTTLRGSAVVAKNLGPNLVGDAQADDAQLRTFSARRATVEWALRRAVRDRPNIQVLGAADGLDVGSSRKARVTGVHTGGRAIATDLLIDAGGRRSPVPGWLAEHGGSALPVRTEPCGIAYASRYFRLRDGVEMPLVRGPILEAANLGFMGYTIGESDARTFSIVFAFPASDRDFRVLHKPAGWDAAAALLPRTAAFVGRDVSEPIMDPAPMYGLDNRLLEWTAGGDPSVEGLAIVGDAWSTTDPLFGWGASFALAHGFGIAAAVAEYGDDVQSAVRAFIARYQVEVEQRYAMSCVDDVVRHTVWSGRDLDPDDDNLRHEARLFAAGRLAREDPTLARALIRRAALLVLPDDIWTEDLVEKADEELAKHPYDARRTRPGPSRQELLGAAAAALPAT